MSSIISPVRVFPAKICETLQFILAIQRDLRSAIFFSLMYAEYGAEFRRREISDICPSPI